MRLLGVTVLKGAWVVINLKVYKWRSHTLCCIKRAEDSSVNFTNALTAAINKVNDQQVLAESLAQQVVAAQQEDTVAYLNY